MDRQERTLEEHGGTSHVSQLVQGAGDRERLFFLEYSRPVINFRERLVQKMCRRKTPRQRGQEGEINGFIVQLKSRGPRKTTR
jgi:hypothetical protein